MSATPGGVLVNDTDTEGDPLTAIVEDDPANGTLTLDADGSFTYVPDADFNGTDTFTYRANDGAIDSGEAIVTIIINPVNDAPVAVADTYTVDEDAVLNVDAVSGVLANDSDMDGDTITATLVDDVINGALTLNADGSFTYTPTTNYNGPDSFTYKTSDGTLDSNTVTVDITVDAVNDGPVAIDDAYDVLEDATLNVDAASGVLENDTDIDTNDVLTVSAVNGNSEKVDTDVVLAHGTVHVNADGSFTYTPDADFNGTDSFTYTAFDQTTNSSAGTVTVTIGAVNDAPSFTKGADQTITEDLGAQTVAGWATLMSAGPVDESGQALDFIVTNDNNTLFSAQPSVATTTGDLTYTTAADAYGLATVSVSLHDDGGGTDTSAVQTFTITVTPDAAPVITAQTSASPAETSLTVTWTTDNPATSRVVYDTVSHAVLGAAPNYGYANSTIEDATHVTSHRVNITGLSSGTGYFFRTVSRGSPETVSDEFGGTTSSPTPAPTPAPSGGDNGAPVGLIGGFGGQVLGANTTAVPGSTGEVLGAAVYNFTKDFGIGSRSTDVEELQKILIAEGFLNVDSQTGYFGVLTRAAVQAYQKAHGITPQSGYVGPLTRAALNKGTTPTMSDEQRAALILSLQAQLNGILERIAALRASGAY
ncbi:MAG: Outer membrane adhesin-like protein [Candidatus Kaiserbacteria bacterium GW2011_GWA2_52_12]|uniref:Outer membrane adhesin-like protein n=1 Tax=Candidatus Kaiserbacteria bacterium GW2011_GWA2_52_12 TaxID=1618671 RepID=A0A0G1WYP7_9BACT|nr:MAG: Outer membrane adhesin-like protein [Candidatus Kaiserbacteria bacterium GW2011_GWA2_52_12]